MESWCLELRRPQSQQFLLRLPFWWFQRGLSVLVGSERWGNMARSLWGQNKKEPWSQVWSSIGFNAERWPRGHQVSISRTYKERFTVDLALAVIVFLMAWSQVSFWQSFSLTWARINGFRPSRDRRINTSSKITVSASNSQRMVCKCSR